MGFGGGVLGWDGETETPRSTDRSARRPDGLDDRRRCVRRRGGRRAARALVGCACGGRGGEGQCLVAAGLNGRAGDVARHLTARLLATTDNKLEQHN